MRKQCQLAVVAAALMLGILTFPAAAQEEVLLYEDFQSAAANQPIAGYNGWEADAHQSGEYVPDSEYTVAAEAYTENKVARLYRPTSTEQSQYYMLKRDLAETVSSGLVRVRFKAARRNRSAKTFWLHLGDSQGNLWEIYGSFAQGMLQPVGAETVYFGDGIKTDAQIGRWYDFEILLDFNAGEFFVKEGGRMIGGRQPIPAEHNCGDVASFYFGTARKEAGSGAVIYMDDICVSRAEAPRVERILPQRDRQTVNPGAKLQIFFNNEVDAESLSAATITVNGAENAADAAVEPTEGKRLDISVRGMAYDTAYAIALSGMKDIYGQSLPAVNTEIRTRKQGLYFSGARFYLNGGEEITRTGLRDGTVVFRMDAVNDSAEQRSATAALAWYRDGRLQNLSMAQWTVNGAESKNQEAALAVSGSGEGESELRCFLLDSTETLQPLRSAVVLDRDGIASERQTQKEFYVSPEGDDRAEGTEKAPWKTLRHAAAAAKAGDTVILEDGTYKESQPTFFGSSGREGAPITIKARNTGQAVIVYGEGLKLVSKFNILQNQNYICVEGLSFRQEGTTQADDPSPTGDIFLMCKGNGCVIANNQFSGAYEEGIKLHLAERCVIENNLVEDMQHEGIDLVNCVGIKIQGNEVAETGRVGIMVKGGSRDCIVRNNLIHNTEVTQVTAAITVGGVTDRNSTYDTGADFGYEIYNSRFYNNIAYTPSGKIMSGLMAMGAKDCAMYNNTVIGGSVAGVRFIERNAETTDWPWTPSNRELQLCNNIFVGCAAAYRMDAEPIGLQSDANLFFNCGAPPVEENSVYRDPQLADPAHYDFRLTEGSPAVGAGDRVPSEFIGFYGDILSAPAVDYEGNGRIEPWHIGACGMMQ